MRQRTSHRSATRSCSPMRRSRDRDRNDLAVDRPDRPALRTCRARRDLRSVHRQVFIPPLAEPTSAGISLRCSAMSRRERIELEPSRQRSASRTRRRRPPVAPADRPRQAVLIYGTAAAIVTAPDGSRTKVRRHTGRVAKPQTQRRRDNAYADRRQHGFGRWQLFWQSAKYHCQARYSPCMDFRRPLRAITPPSTRRVGVLARAETEMTGASFNGS